MKNILRAGTAVAAILLVAGTVQAADVLPEPPPMTDWSGFYIGGHVGYGWANMSGCYECEDDSSVLEADDLDLEGIVAGLHAGYNWQMDSIIFGIEGDVSFVDMDDSGGSPETVPSEVQTSELDLLASVRARLGIALDSAMIYATGGIAFADAEWGVTDDVGGTPSSDAFDFGDIGGVVGGGVEYAMTDAIRLRAEGLYYIFDDKEDIGDAPGANTGESIEFDDVFVVRGGVSFYFNL